MGTGSQPDTEVLSKVGSKGWKTDLLSFVCAWPLGIQAYGESGIWQAFLLAHVESGQELGAESRLSISVPKPILSPSLHFVHQSHGRHTKASGLSKFSMMEALRC